MGFLNCFDVVVMLNTNALVRIFTYCGGEYSSIFMHGTVSTDTDGVTTTELPVAVQIRTPYICCYGSELNLIVALGTDISVNFIFQQCLDEADWGCS